MGSGLFLLGVRLRRNGEATQISWITPGLTHQLPKTPTARGIAVCRARSADDFFLPTMWEHRFFRRKRHVEAALFDYQVVTGVW